MPCIREIESQIEDLQNCQNKSNLRSDGGQLTLVKTHVKPFVLPLFKGYEVSFKNSDYKSIECESINHFQIQLSTSSALAVYVAYCLRVI